LRSASARINRCRSPWVSNSARCCANFRIAHPSRIDTDRKILSRIASRTDPTEKRT
jgi:hypothetical protein